LKKKKSPTSTKDPGTIQHFKRSTLNCVSFRSLQYFNPLNITINVRFKGSKKFQKKKDTQFKVPEINHKKNFKFIRGLTQGLLQESIAEKKF
jgi:hypothetical protein